MDLLPTPGQVVAAAGNLTHKLLHRSLADLRPMPRTLIDEGDLREVYHYGPDDTGDQPSDQPDNQHGDPVLLVSPLAAPALCFDLRRGCSLVEHFVGAGRPTYLVEYGEVSFANRSLGLEPWVDDVLPAAISAVSAHTGGRGVHVVGWGPGGIFALLTAADRPDLPIASVTTLGVPVDVTQVPLVAPTRPFLGLTGDGAGLVTLASRLMGDVPLVGQAYRVTGLDKLVGKPIAIAAKIDDADFLAQVEAVERFTASTTDYPGRTFGQLYHRLLKGNQLANGRVTLDDRDIDLADLRTPLLAVAGASDAIAPVDCVRSVAGLVPKARQVRLEVVPGGHLGMLTGRAARTTTWRVLDEWIDAHTAAEAPTVPTAVPTPGPAATRSSRSSRGGRPRADAIGANPSRRYGSGSSRSLAARK